jgi:predicted MFS family arabinose efflux permease
MLEGTEASHGVWSPVPPRVRMLILSQVLNGFAFGFFLIYITGFLPEHFIDAGTVGWLLGIEGLSMVVFAIPFALQSDRRERKWFLLAGNLVFPPMILLFALTRDVWIYYLAAGLAGLGEALSLSSYNAMIADMTDLRNRDSAFSLSFITGTASFSLGAGLPLVFPLLQGLLGVDSIAIHTWALGVLGAVNFASPVFVWLILKGHVDTRKVSESKGLGLEGMGQTLKFSLINSCIGLGAGLIIPLMATWLLKKFGVTDTFSGPYLALSGLTIAFAAIASPRVSKKIGLFPAMIVTAGSSTVFMFSLALVSNVYLAGVLYLIRAALMNMNSPLMDSFLMGITPPERRGLASTLNAVIWRVPNNVSSILGGAMLKSAAYGIPALGLTNYDTPWVFASALYAVGIGLLYANFRHVKPAA